MDDFFALEGVSCNRGQHTFEIYLQSSELSMVVHFKTPVGKKQVRELIGTSLLFLF